MKKDAEAEPITSKDGSPTESAAPAKGHDSEIISGKQSLVVQNEDELQLSPEDFHANDNKVLELFTNEKSVYSFKGIMRKLDIHQQSLARALHRLEYLGLVERSAAGYALSKDGESMLSIIGTAKPRTGRPYMQLLQTFVPINMKAHEIAHSLAGKWFKNLRWLGVIESEMGYTLQWVDNNGGNPFQVNLKIASGFIVIEANPSSEEEKVKAMVGSYAIFEQITKIFQGKISNASSYVFSDQYYPHRNN